MAAEGVRELHMSKLAHFQGEYRPWKGDENRRIRFIKKIVAIIKKYTIRHVVTTLQSSSSVQYVTPFQAADFLAYEFYKGVKEMRSTGRHEINGRKSLLALVPVGPDEYSRVIDIHALAVYVKTFGVTRRAPSTA